MSLLRRMVVGLQSLFRKEQVSQELDEELNDFLEMAAEEKMKQGMSRRDALRAVRLERGSVEITKEIVRSAGWESLVETCWQDLRFAARMLRKNPGFTAVAVLTLALGIGANTAIFSLMNAVLLRSLPVRDPNRLVQFAYTSTSDWNSWFDYPQFQVVRERATKLSGVFGGTSLGRVNGIGPGVAGLANGGAYTANFFSVLGVEPQVGRLFTSDDDKPGTAIIILSDAYWRRQFGGDAGIVGRVLSINGVPFTVAGVAQRGFTGT